MGPAKRVGSQMGGAELMKLLHLNKANQERSTGRDSTEGLEILKVRTRAGVLGGHASGSPPPGSAGMRPEIWGCNIYG